MAEKTEKNKSGAGKFFLGALLGGIAGAIAGRFITTKADEDDSECEEKFDCDKKGCPCKKGAENAEIEEVKKPAGKSSPEKKTAEKK